MDILLVEDDPAMREGILSALTAAGLSAVDRASAEDALSLIDESPPPRVVVTDVNLGEGMDGMDFADRVHRVWPEMPVVFISGREFDRARLSRRERFVPKPFPASALLSAIEEVGAA